LIFTTTTTTYFFFYYYYYYYYYYSPQTTSAYLPSHAELSTHANELKRAALPP